MNFVCQCLIINDVPEFHWLRFKLSVNVGSLNEEGRGGLSLQTLLIASLWSFLHVQHNQLHCSQHQICNQSAAYSSPSRMTQPSAVPSFEFTREISKSIVRILTRGEFSCTPRASIQISNVEISIGDIFNYLRCGVIVRISFQCCSIPPVLPVKCQLRIIITIILLFIIIALLMNYF